ncbi:adipolin [Trichonephila clavipes]|nr:adipolin [Trichonephila clavipes]
MPVPKALIGPAGPRGPIGPPGPPGANITKEEMFEEFRQMIIKLIQNEVVHLPNSKLASLESNITKIKMQNILFEKELHTPKVMSAFMWELQDYIKVPKSSRIELDMFKESNRGGTLSRSMGSLKSVSGRFEAPRTGFYHFNARIHIYVPLRRKIPNELFTVSFCVSGNCEKKIGTADDPPSSSFLVAMVAEGVWSRTRCQNVTSSSPGATEDPPYERLMHVKSVEAPVGTV